MSLVGIIRLQHYNVRGLAWTVLMWDSVLGECEFGWHCSVTALQRARKPETSSSNRVLKRTVVEGTGEWRELYERVLISP